MPIMNLLFVVLLSMMGFTKQFETQEKLKIIQQIIQQAVKDSNCVVYTSYATNIAPLIVEEALQKVDKHTMYTTNQQIKNMNCNVFIIFAETLEGVETTFAENIRESDQLLMRKKILIFYKGTAVFEKEYLMGIFPKGTRVVFVEGLSDDMTQIWNKTAAVTYRPPKMTFGFSGREITLKSAKDVNLRSFQQKTRILRLDRKFRISLFRCTPFVVYNQNSNTFTGTEYNMIKEVLKDFELEYLFHEHTKENAYSFWNEVVNEVSRGDSDIALCSLWQSAHIRRNVSLTYPHNQLCITFLVPKPKLLSEVSYVFQPFHLSLWLLVIAAVLITCFFVRLLTYFCHTDRTNRQSVAFSDNFTPILHAIRIFTLGSVKGTIPTTQTHLRVLFIVFAFAGLCLSTAYSAGFTSSLTYPRYSEPIWTIKDMIKQNVKISVKEHVDENEEASFKSFLNEFVNPDVRSLANQFASDDSDKYSHARLVKVWGGRYVTDTEDMDDYSKTHYQVLRECIMQENIVFVLQRNSPFISFINKQIQRFIEHGFVDYWYKKSLIESDMSYMSNFYTTYVENIRPKPLHGKKLQGAFYLLNCGLLLSFIVFLAELMY